ncbi:ECF transporter S component [Metabacillus sp. KIGAM252]|uniref:Riboflavin transporter n=1 Tax=Metabacillus flavus TaxID=2823519 RepID=A0ABS5LFS3_9BACI|nr:ECF transporter S component [Metabacillus flavus]MBS2969449.1 ECF transporter S component [Metabacillus flavus]
MVQSSIRKRVITAVLSSIAYLLMMLEIPYPGSVFLKFDFSDLPALAALILFGPGSALTVEALKNILHYFIQGSGTGVPIGEAANFVSAALLILPVWFFYKRNQAVKGLLIGLGAGTIAMTVLMAVFNYYVILPAYTYFLGAQQMNAEQIYQFIILGILPFNLIKGILISVIFTMVYVRMKAWFEQKSVQTG